MYFNMDYSAFSSGVPLMQSSAFESSQGSGFGGDGFGRPGGGRTTAAGYGAEEMLREPSFPLWEDHLGGKGLTGMRFERPAMTEGSMYKDFSRKKPRERSPNNVQDLYKTELCNSFTDSGSCPYGANCQFAHGMEELRAVTRHPKYKTKMCRNYAEKGSCPYGSRCRFIHGDEDDSLLDLENDVFPAGPSNVGVLGNISNGNVTGVANPSSVGAEPAVVNGGANMSNSLYFRAPSPEAKLPPTFPALKHTIPVSPGYGKMVMKGNLIGLKNDLPVGGTASAPASTATSPVPFEMAGGQPIRASTPTPQPSAPELSPVKSNPPESQKTEVDAPKRRLAIFEKLAN